jgi:dolichyl-phosphate mannosyltransferase polypeptide 2 regulatory subunit
VCNLLLSPFKVYYTKNLAIKKYYTTVGSTRWICHALGSYRHLSLLYGMDAVNGMPNMNHLRAERKSYIHASQPFVDPGHPLHDIFPPRVWAIRIPVILTLLGSAVVGSFLGIVMVRSSRKKAAKARAAAAKKKA